MKILSIVGSGGHASVVLDAALLSHPNTHLEIFDEDPSRAESSLLNIKIQLGLPENPLVHVAIGDNQTRKRLGEMLCSHGKELYTIIHPAAIIARASHIETGCFVAANAVIAPNANIEEGCILNHSAVIDHDCRVGAWTHIAPKVALGGGVHIENGCLIGAGAIVLPRIHIGEKAVIGAGAVVTRNVAAGETVVGIPATSLYSRS